MRRSRVAALSLSAVLTITVWSSAPVQAQDGGSRTHNYVVSLVGPGALLAIGATATFDHLRNDPETWGKSAEGFGRRAASAAGSRAANQTVRHGLAAVLDHTTEYRRCSCTGFGSRLGHAVAGAFTDRNEDGDVVFSIPQVGGAVAGAYAPLLWRPDYSSGRAAAGVGMSFGWAALSNVAREFVLH